MQVDLKIFCKTGMISIRDTSTESCAVHIIDGTIFFFGEALWVPKLLEYNRYSQSYM